MSRVAGTSRAWTPEEDRRLREMYAAGTKQAMMATVLGRPVSSIPSRLERLRIRVRRVPALPGLPGQPKVRGQRLCTKDGGPGECRPRTCLCCCKSFLSAHGGNRLCGRCRNQAVSPYAP